MADRTDFGQVNWSLKDDHAEERKRHLDDVWKHIRPLNDKPVNGPKGPTSNSTIDDLAKMGITFGDFDDDTHTTPAREMEKVSIGPIPESEEQNAKAWYSLFESLKTVECCLDPRLNHKDGTPYDPIDLTFRIVDAIKTLKGIRSKIADRFCFTEPHIHDYSFSAF